jgi:polyhydroxyalkanoate synthesis regulator phasin
VASGREQYLQALASLSDLTRAQADRVAALLAKQGEVQSAQVGRVAEDLMRRTQKNREIMTRLVQREVKRQLGVLGMATRDEVARLQQRVRALEQELERASKTARPTTTSGTSKAASSKTKAASPGSAATASTRTGGTSSRSTASSPGTRRARAAKPKAGRGDGEAGGQGGGQA